MQPLAALAGAWTILLIPFVLGLAGGFQTIHTKFDADSPRVLTTFSGWIYWLSRALVPTAVYVIWYRMQQPPQDSVLTALLCGVGSEAILRSRFYLGERKQSDGKVEEVAKGVFDLVHWYQALCLKAAGDKLATERQLFIETLLANETDFVLLARRAHSNAGAWAIEEEKQKLLAVVSDLQTKFTKAAQNISGSKLEQLNREFILEFGYAAMRMVGRKSLKTLFK